MSSAFLQLLNMSITAGWIVLAVLILRLCLKKAPRWITCLLWGLVALRLILPFNIESPFSLIPSAETVVSTDFGDTSSPVVNSGMGSIDKPLNDWLHTPLKPQPKPIVQPPAPPVEGDNTVSNPTTPNQPLGDTNPNTEHRPPIEDEIVAPEQESDKSEVKSVSRAERVLQIAAPLWLVGIALMLIYELMSILSVHHRVLDAVLRRDTVWESDRVETPFIFGLFRPRIYVPYGLDEQSLELIVAHERAHLHRLDHWLKPFAFTLLAVYWYNPLLWIAYFLLCRDIEVACDERVVKNLSAEDRRLYAAALLKCGSERRTLIGCPLAFGELSIRQRIFSIIGYRKPLIWVVIVSLLVCVLAALCLLTVPQSAVAQGVIDDVISNTTTATTTTTATVPSTTVSVTHTTVTTQPSTKPSIVVKPTDANHAHAYGDWSIVKAPTCDTNGRRERVCSCGNVQEQAIDAVGHTYIKNVCVTCGDNGGTGFIPDYSYGQANIVGNEDGKYYVAQQGDWIYYTTNYRFITKCRVDGTVVSKVYSVTKGSILNLNVVGDWIYFFVYAGNIKDSYIAKVRTDGSGFAYLLQSVDINEMLVVNDKLFFTMYSNTYVKTYCPLYMMPLHGGLTQQLNEGYVVHLTSDGNYLYYEQSPKSGNDVIYRLNLSTMQRSIVFSNYQGGNFVLKDDHIYYTLKDDEVGDYIINLFCLQDGSVTVLGRPQYMQQWFSVIGNCIYYCGMPDTDEWWNQDAGIVEYYPRGSDYEVIYVTSEALDSVNIMGLGDYLVWRDYSDEANYGRILRIYDCSASRWIPVTG